MIELEFDEVIIRILLAIFLGGLVGYEREVKGGSAGFRTHILVCVGATMIALIQIRATNQILTLAKDYQDYLQILSMDNTRLTAQIVSGIGFLGAGTIIVTKRSISGLTTAASIWTTASIGIALGMGFYDIAFVATLIIIITLTFIKRKLNISVGENLVIRYVDEKVEKDLSSYFKENQIKYSTNEFRIENDSTSGGIIYTEHLTLNLPSGTSISDVIRDVGKLESIIYASSQKNLA